MASHAPAAQIFFQSLTAARKLSESTYLHECMSTYLHECMQMLPMKGRR
jgi:hypothetical protein